MKRINPNLVTISRVLVFLPVACFLLAYGFLPLALVAMIFGELTDAFDGPLARKTNQISKLGKILDPLCDSIFHVTIWMMFQSLNWVPVYFVIVFFLRDIVVAYIRICFASHNTILAARKSGKIKAIAQSFQIVIVLRLLFAVKVLEYSQLEYIQLAIVSLAAIVTLYSLWDYSKSFYQLVKEKGSVLG